MDVIEPLSEETINLANEVSLNNDLKVIIKEILYSPHWSGVYT